MELRLPGNSLLTRTRETAAERRRGITGLFTRRDSVLLVFVVAALSEENLFEDLGR